MRAFTSPSGGDSGTTEEFKGSLEDIPVFDLYRHLYLSRGTGTLELHHQNASKHVVFRHGSIVFALTNQESERLGKLLLNDGRITASQLLAMAAESRPGRRFGQIAVENAYLEGSELDQYVRRHQSEVVFSTMEWETGEFCFRQSQPTEYEDVFIDLSTADIIFEGVRRIGSLERVGRLLGTRDVRLRLASDPLLRFQRISLDPQEAYIFSRVERSMTVEEISQVSALEEGPTLRSLLGLLLTGILEYDEDADGDRQSELARPDVESRQETERVRRSDPGLEQVLRARLESLSSATFYEILEVSPGATSPEIKRSYFQLAKRFHPDKYSHAASLNLLRIGEQVFTSISDAYRILMDPVQREKYDSLLRDPDGTEKRGRKGAAVSEAGRRRSVQAIAKQAFEEGLEYYNRDDYRAALRKFREAVRIDGSMAPHRFYLAQTLARLPQRRREAEFHYQIAIHDAPWNPEYHHALAQLYESAGLSGRAKCYFGKARELESRSCHAAPHFTPPKQQGILSKLFHH